MSKKLKNLRIRAKILYPVLIVTVLMAASLLVTNIWQFSASMDEELSASVKTSSAAIRESVEDLKVSASIASAYIAANREIAGALEAGNREQLQTIASSLQAEAGMEFCTITDPEGNVVLRTHEPDNYGDSIASQSNIKAAMSGNRLVAAEEGSAVKLSIRAGTPVFSEAGEIVGIVSVGHRLDTESFVDAQKAIHGVEVAVLNKGGERISTTVLKPDGARSTGTVVANTINTTLLGGQDHAGADVILLQPALVRYTPILDANGEVVGSIFTGRRLAGKEATMQSFIFTGLIVLLVFFTAGAFVLWKIVNSITRPLGAMSRFFKHANETGSLEISPAEGAVIANLKGRTDELGILSDSLGELVFGHISNIGQLLDKVAGHDLAFDYTPLSDKDTMGVPLRKMLDDLNATFDEITTASAQVNIGAQQIASGAQTTAQGSTEQAASIQECASSLTQANAAALRNAEITGTARTENQHMKDMIDECAELMQHIRQAMAEILDTTKGIAYTAKVTDDIAFQTNILSLNAAVEAARAGQHGKGFTVVAEEVRNLSQKSATAAQEAATLTEKTNASVRRGNELVQIAEEKLQKVVAIASVNVEQVALLHSDAVGASEALSAISANVEQISSVVQQNSATAEESAAASEELSGQAEELMQQVRQFELRNATSDSPLSLLPKH